MAKISAWLITIIGVFLILPVIGVMGLEEINTWLIPLLVLVLGVTKLARNYKWMKI